MRAPPEGSPTHAGLDAGTLAGAEGIEPSNAGIKIRCLTTWRRPNFVVAGCPARSGIKPAGPPRKPPKMPLVQGFVPAPRPVAGAGGHRYKGASRGEGASFRTGSGSSSAW